MNKPVGPGQIIDKQYEVSEQLGQGSFGVTYLARNLSNGANVAIKLFDREGVDRETTQRMFRAEITVLRSLRHPGIVNWLDAGLSDDGRPYYVAEWVRGADLATILRTSGGLGVQCSLQVAAGVAEALAYIHRGHLVHRDLKPSNVLIPGWPSEPDFTAPKVIDFGLAGSLDHGRTEPGMIYGTLLYMSPEQILGESQTAAVDIYGLGMLLFEMITGRWLWASLGPSWAAVAQAILSGAFPSRAFDGMPVQVAELIRRCLQRDPSERPDANTVLLEFRELGETGAWRKGHRRELAPASARWIIECFQRLPFWLAPVLAVLVLFVIAENFGVIPPRALAVVCGVLWTGLSVTLGFWLRRRLGLNSSGAARAYELAVGAKTRVDLTASIRLQMNDLVRNLRALDDRVLASSVALMLQEYEQAAEAKDRQSALMNVVSLSEKLGQRLSPWYVRHKDVIASGVAVLGALTGLLTAISGLRAHKP